MTCLLSPEGAALAVPSGPNNVPSLPSMTRADSTPNNPHRKRCGVLVVLGIAMFNKPKSMLHVSDPRLDLVSGTYI